MKNFKLMLLAIVAVMLVLAGCADDTKEEKQTENISVTREEKKVETPADTNLEMGKEEPSEKEEEPKEQKEEKKSHDLGKIKEEIMLGIGASGALDFNANSISALYGIDASDMKQYAGFSVMAGTFPHEVVMIEASSDEAALRIEKAFGTKITAFAEQSKNYDAENYALAQKCKIEKNGRYYAMFLSPDYLDIKGIYNKYIK